MTFTTKIRTVTSASLVAILAAAPLAAQDIGAGATTATTLGVDTGLESGTDAEMNAEADAGVEAGTTDVAQTGTETGSTDPADATAEAVVVVASDAAVIGDIESTQEDPSGRVIYNVVLDPSLGLDIERVAFSTDADVNAEGELTLDMTGEEFAAAVQSRIDAMGGAETATN